MMMPRNDNRRSGDCRTGNTGRGCGNGTASNDSRTNHFCANDCRSCPLSRGGRAGNNCQARAWMRRLQVVDFALQELILYLDMYPDCRRALQKYHALKEEREKLVKMLQESGVPICAVGNENRERWDWTDAPWPWEYDFIGNAKD